MHPPFMCQYVKKNKNYTKNFLKAEKLDGLLEKVIDFVIKT